MSRFIAKTLRTRLTVFYAVLIAGALILYAVCVSAFYLHSLREQMDASLSRDVETIEGNLYMTSDGRVELSSHEGEADEYETENGYLLEVFGLDGTTLYQSKQLNGETLGQPLDDFLREESGHPTSFRLSSGALVRTISRRHQMAGGKLVVVRLAINEEPYWREFREMLGILGLGLPIVVTLVFVAGYLVAKSALRPVDVMARRAAEITAEHLNERIAVKNQDDELGQLGTAFNSTLARLENSFDQLRRFTADASHELRTPLTSIRSVGEVALSKGGDEKYYRDIIGSMLEEVDRLTRLVESLLTISRADAGHIQLQRSPIVLLDLAQESAALLEVLAEEKNQVITTGGDASITVWADRLILRQALINLIDNAVKYSPEGGKIRVHVQTVNGNAVIEVWDSGPGIPPMYADKVFQRFYRIDKARSRAEGGAGLGLSIVQWAVSAHGGKVELMRDAAPGCAFVIHLPLERLEESVQREEGQTVDPSGAVQ